MGYIYAVLSVFLGNLKGFCGKKSSDYIKSTNEAAEMNMLRMALCAVVGFIILFFQNRLSLPERNEIPIFILSAVSISFFVLSWIKCVRTDAYLTIDVFLMLATVIPITLSGIFFKERVLLKQIIGLTVILAASCFMNLYNSKIKGKMSFKSILLVMLCAASNGIYDFSQKIYVNTSDNFSGAKINFYTYLFSFFILLAYVGGASLKKHKVELPDRHVYLYTVIMSVSLYGSSLFKTIAAQTVPSIRLYPLSQGLSLIVSTIMASVFFKEKANKYSIVGMILAFMGLIIMNT